MTKREKIGIIGAGAWGTALAVRLAQNHDIFLWAHEKDTVQAITQNRENRFFLPQIALPETICAVNEFAALSDCPIVFFVPPAQFLRVIARAAKPHLPRHIIAIICSKGIEVSRNNQESGALMSAVLAEELPEAQTAILSGPSFAREAAQDLPLALTLAAEESALRTKLVNLFSKNDFRLYPTDDVIGAQIGGAVKNVLAIACGIIEGRKLGQNARATVIARGLAETRRLTEKLGGQPATLMSLAGIGDIVLTCTSAASRNMSLGIALGSGQSLNEIVAARKSVSEGIHTAASLRQLAKRHGLLMPICFAVHDILSGQISIDRAIDRFFENDISETEI